MLADQGSSAAVSPSSATLGDVDLLFESVRQVLALRLARPSQRLLVVAQEVPDALACAAIPLPDGISFSIIGGPISDFRPDIVAIRGQLPDATTYVVGSEARSERSLYAEASPSGAVLFAPFEGDDPRNSDLALCRHALGHPVRPPDVSSCDLLKRLAYHHASVWLEEIERVVSPSEKRGWPPSFDLGRSIAGLLDQTLPAPDRVTLTMCLEAAVHVPRVIRADDGNEIVPLVAAKEIDLLGEAVCERLLVGRVRPVDESEMGIRAALDDLADVAVGAIDGWLGRCS